MTIARKIINQNSAVLELINGTNLDGKDFFAYMLFPADVLKSIKPRMEKEEIEISKYGIVVYSDFGINPPKGLDKIITDHINNNWLVN